MILKLLLIIVVVTIVYFVFFKKKPQESFKPKTKTKKDEKLQSNDMVECATCGTYAELCESIISNNKYYCSDECLEKA